MADHPFIQRETAEAAEWELHFIAPVGERGEVEYCFISIDADGNETWWESQVAPATDDILATLSVFRPDRMTVSSKMRDLSDDSPAHWACHLARSFNRGEI